MGWRADVQVCPSGVQRENRPPGPGGRLVRAGVPRRGRGWGQATLSAGFGAQSCYLAPIVSRLLSRIISKVRLAFRILTSWESVPERNGYTFCCSGCRATIPTPQQPGRSRGFAFSQAQQPVPGFLTRISHLPGAGGNSGTRAAEARPTASLPTE